MVTATDLRNHTTFLIDGKPFRVVKYTHQKIGRGGATVRLSCKNLETGSLAEYAFSSASKFEEITTSKKALQFLYQDRQNAVFMDPLSFEQIEMPLSILGSDAAFLKHGETADVLFWNDRPLSLELPPKITLTVTQTDPGVKGNSATNIFKPATLENNLVVKVPLFIKPGDHVRLDTRTGEYLERVS